MFWSLDNICASSVSFVVALSVIHIYSISLCLQSFDCLTALLKTQGRPWLYMVLAVKSDLAPKPVD